MSWMAPGAETVQVKLWTGFNSALLLSVVTVLAGLAVLRCHGKIITGFSRVSLPIADALYDRVLAGVVALANWQTRLLQSGYLRNYLLIILGATGALIGLKLWRYGGLEAGSGMYEFSWPTMVVALMMFFAIGLAITAKKRLTALIALGVIGYGVALIFAVYSAPDLAITQILVETLTVALFAWVVYKLPGLRQFSTRRTVWVDGVVSLGAGVLVTLLILKSKAVQFAPSISEQLTEWSAPEAHGNNVVNVILVDFRALDTFGEVMVLAIAAVGVWALLIPSGKSQSKPQSKS